jgi:hypothetical protein
MYHPVGNNKGVYSMKKLMVIAAIIGVVMLAMGTAGMIYARVQAPVSSNTDLNSEANKQRSGDNALPGNRNRGNFGPCMMQNRGPQGNDWGKGYGPGMMRQGRGQQGNPGFGMMGLNSSPMQQYMLNALVDKLSITPIDLQTRLTNGDTPYQIAQSQGLTDTQVSDLFKAAQDAALAQAVTDSVLTQQQADLMGQHMDQNWPTSLPGFGFGFGTCPGGNAPGWKP